MAPMCFSDSRVRSRGLSSQLDIAQDEEDACGRAVLGAAEELAGERTDRLYASWLVKVPNVR